MLNKTTLFSVMVGLATTACQSPKEEQPTAMEDSQEFQWQTEQFADIRILRYQVPAWEKLTPKQRLLAYYLNQAGLSGRDIIYDQNYRHNLEIRKALEIIVGGYTGDKTTEDWKAFETYAKRVWFSNGIHHHYSNAKFKPGFGQAYLGQFLEATGASLSEEAQKAIFDPEFDAKKVDKSDGVDLTLASAVNFYAPDIKQAEVEAFYAKYKDANNPHPVAHGINTTLVRNAKGELEEQVWRVGGKYTEAIEKVVYWLEKAVTVAENEAQAKALGLLIDYYKTGDLATWDAYNIAWTEATEGDVDYINSFIEVYNDPMGIKASFESIVQIKDFEASERMAVVASSVQWFEDNSPIMKEHKKANVVGVTYKIVNAAGEGGDAAPSTPIGVNLPNSDWIRAEHGSKSVSLGNIEDAYEKAAGKGMLNEFAFSNEERERAEKYGELGGKMHTALHEVVGHASGKLNPGIGTPKSTLKNYASTLEEARADLVALYYIMDPKMIELGLMENNEAGKAEYDGYIRNGLMLQLRRLELGENLEEDHMRNRQLVAGWAYEMGKNDQVIEKKVVEGKTYFVVNDYDKLRTLFGQLLREIQRIKSEGDFEAGRNLVETYGVKVDPAIHKEVLERSEKLNIAPYAGFIQPEMVPVMENDSVVDVKLEYPTDFTKQMLKYGKEYGFLPVQK